MIGESPGINGEDGTFDVDDVVRVGNWTGTPPATNTYGSFTAANPTGTLNTNVNNIPAANPANGWGDPCVIYFSGSYGGGWKTPTGNPWRGMGNTNPFGVTELTSSNPYWRDIPVGYGYSGGALSTDGGFFLPAAGWRSPSTGTGEVYAGASLGMYWTATARASNSLFRLNFGVATIDAALYPTSNSTAIPVRCVK